MHAEQKTLISMIRQGFIFIYPTDTVYGIGCNALDKKAVKKIKQIKGRDAKKPLSVIAPSKAWIYQHCHARRSVLDRFLPGRYTLILRKKDRRFLRHVSAGDTIGVRIPKHWFTHLVRRAQVPLITTSANRSGDSPAQKIEDLHHSLLKKADVLINDGKLYGKPSSIVLEDGTVLRR